MTSRAPVGRVAHLARRGSRAARAVLAGALVVAPATQAAAAPAVPTLKSDVTLTAQATGFVRVRLSRPLDLNAYLYRHPPAFTGSGGVAFAFIPDTAADVRRNFVVVRTTSPMGTHVMESPGSLPTTGSENHARYLRPGVYRLFFATRGGGSVRLRLPGQPQGATRVAAATRVPWKLQEFTAPLDASGHAPSTWAATLDFDGRQPGHVFGAMWYHSAATTYVQSDSCFYKGWSGDDRSAPMCLNGHGRGPIARAGPAVDKVDRVWTGAVFDAPPGKQGLRVCYASAGAVRGAKAMLFFLPTAA